MQEDIERGMGLIKSQCDTYIYEKRLELLQRYKEKIQELETCIRNEYDFKSTKMCKHCHNRTLISDWKSHIDYLSGYELLVCPICKKEDI